MRKHQRTMGRFSTVKHGRARDRRLLRLYLDMTKTRMNLQEQFSRPLNHEDLCQKSLPPTCVQGNSNLFSPSGLQAPELLTFCQGVTLKLFSRIARYVRLQRYR